MSRAGLLDPSPLQNLGGTLRILDLSPEPEVGRHRGITLGAVTPDFGTKALYNTRTKLTTYNNTSGNRKFHQSQVLTDETQNDTRTMSHRRRSKASVYTQTPAKYEGAI